MAGCASRGIAESRVRQSGLHLTWPPPAHPPARLPSHQELFAPFKMNLASIGNIVSQLHVHVTGRLEGDLAWPGPCYGAVPPVALTPARAEFMLSALRKALDRLKA